ncbi:MAG TPA: cohesin domain-containing protein [Anaerolineae bacterium]
MQKLRSGFMRWLILVASLLLAAAPARAQATTQVRVTPAELQLSVGQTSQITIDVAGVQGLYGVDLSLTFDPNAVEAAGSAPAQVEQGAFLDAGFVIVNQADNAAGTVHFAMTQINPSEPKNGSGTLINVKLRGKKEGAASALTLTKVDLVTRDGTLISGTLVSGQVSVISTSPGTPTATPLPAATQAGPTALPPTLAPAQTPASTALAQITVLDTPAPGATATLMPVSMTPQQTVLTQPAANAPAIRTNPPAALLSTTQPSPSDPGTPTVPGAIHQPANNATAVPETLPRASTPGMALQAAAGVTPVPALASGAVAGETPVPPAVHVAGGVITALPAAQRAMPVQADRGLNNSTIQTALVLGGFSIGLVLFMATITGFFIVLPPLPAEPVTSQNSGRTSPHV